MKACSYCGRKNDDDAKLCPGCGTEFPIPQAKEIAGDEAPAPRCLPTSDLSQLDMGFEIVDGFSRPNWGAIYEFVNGNISEEDLEATWCFIAKTWLEQLAKDLGRDSHIHQSNNFFCLSDLNHETTRNVLTYAESVVGIIRNSLKEAAWTGYHGKHVLLAFSDLDDYFAYISYFYGEGSHALSGGMCIVRGYVHIALPYTNPRVAEYVLVHELVHNLLSHLPIPTWLNEGLAVAIESKMLRRPFLIDRELADRHRRHWNETNIQSFWAGKSFDVPGEESDLSYSLSEILVVLLSEKGNDFINFTENADWRDAGQDAALNCLGLDLGEVAAGFLGAGNWRPQRKAIAEYLKRKPLEPKNGEE